MKNKIGIIIIALVILSGAIALSLRSTKSEAKVSTPINNSSQREELSGSSIYTFDTASSKIVWEGTKTMIKGWVDTGDVAIKSGDITVSGDKVTGGKVVVDMNTIAARKTGGGKGEDMLSGHLKSPDFFDVAAFPTSDFSLSSIERNGEKFGYTAKGEMTIKGITKPIEFPASIYMQDGRLELTARIVIDRSQFVVKYGSKTFFDDLGDKAVDNDFVLNLALVAKK